MRLWHYKLIPYLPRTQLIAQWRECISIAKNINKNGTPNHILVNKILNYSNTDFNIYCNHVLYEMIKRGYNVSSNSISKLEKYIDFNVDSKEASEVCFKNWHDNIYLEICYFNLKEKYMCGQKDFSEDEWNRLDNFFNEER